MGLLDSVPKLHTDAPSELVRVALYEAMEVRTGFIDRLTKFGAMKESWGRPALPESYIPQIANWFGYSPDQIFAVSGETEGILMVVFAPGPGQYNFAVFDHGESRTDIIIYTKICRATAQRTAQKLTAQGFDSKMRRGGII